MPSSTLTPPVPALLVRWRRQCDAIGRHDVELTTEEFAALLSTFKTLRDAGHRFPRAVVSLMAALEYQAQDTDDGMEDRTDSDSDHDYSSAWGSF